MWEKSLIQHREFKISVAETTNGLVFILFCTFLLTVYFNTVHMKIVQKFIVFEKREKRHGKGKFIKITWQGPFTEKSYSLSIPFWGEGVTQMTMFNPDTDCTYVCFVTLLPTSWTWSVKIYRGIALWYRAWQLSLLKFVYKISPEKKTYIGGVTTN